MQTNNVKKLVESAVLLAIATILSMIKLADLPYGGSVTIASMLPIIIVSYRYGVKWGLVTGFVYGVIQQLLGLNTLSWVTTWQSILAVILLDYIIAFMVTGFGGSFRKKTTQPMALLFGALLVGILRYICHVISGATVWAGLSIPDSAALIYSMGYNATYMIPETIVTMVIAYYLGSILDFRKSRISQMKEKSGRIPVTVWIGGIIIVAALVFDTVAVFSKLQDPETGDFIITGLSKVNWLYVGIVSAAAAVVSAILFIISGKRKKA